MKEARCAAIARGNAEEDCRVPTREGKNSWCHSPHVRYTDLFKQTPWIWLCQSTSVAPCKGVGVATRSARSLGVFH